MSVERERMDIYTGSDEDEQIDMWLFDPALRPHYDAIDDRVLRREQATCKLTNEQHSDAPGFWQKLVKHCHGHRHIRNAGEGFY
jgi:hypothetical protein